MNIKLSEKQIKDYLNEMVVIVDTKEKEKDGEKKNQHILDFFDKKGIKYKSKNLEFGDYTIMLPAKQEFGIMLDLYFDSNIVVERKANLEELSNNLVNRKQDGESGGRIRFEKEMMRAKFKGTTFILMVENASLDKIYSKDYKTGLNKNSFKSTLLTFNSRFGLQPTFISKERAGEYIKDVLYCHVREILKNNLLDKINCK